MMFRGKGTRGVVKLLTAGHSRNAGSEVIFGPSRYFSPEELERGYHLRILNWKGPLSNKD